MSHDVNRYRCDLRDIRFLLFEQFGLGDLLGRPPYADWAQGDIDAILDGVYQWACAVIGPLNAVGDRVGCTLCFNFRCGDRRRWSAPCSAM